MVVQLFCYKLLNLILVSLSKAVLYLMATVAIAVVSCLLSLIAAIKEECTNTFTLSVGVVHVIAGRQ